jgi:mRNA interferase RelE/StbE
MGQAKDFSLTYHRLVPRDLNRLDSFWKVQVLGAIEEKLLTEPDYFGKPLRQALRGCRSLRVGDYRIVFRIQQRTVTILAIVHRSTEYKDLEQRI